MWYLYARRGSKYFKVVSDSLTLVADLCRTILVGGPLWTQFNDVVVLAVETSPKNSVIQDMINSENSMNTTESTNTNISKIKFDLGSGQSLSVGLVSR